MQYVFGKINYGGLKHNSLYLGLVLPSGGDSLIKWHNVRLVKHKSISLFFKPLVKRFPSVSAVHSYIKVSCC